ncbi:MAG: hypothetical protein DMG11_33485 [Acidobacteria bacterium]|nr:MAG: hypothetical protein DMG11_33485 [Acidobacteriota bacterium]
MSMQTASIGFRAKTGRAIAVALTSGNSGPAFLARWEVALHDPHRPATGQPHHEVMEMPWLDAQSAVRPFEQQIESIAVEVLSGLLKELQSKGCRVGSIGVVGSPDRKLEAIGNPHIRAHAAEGILFRRVLEVAADEHKLRWRSFSDRTFNDQALAELRRKPQDLTTTLVSIGHSAGKPWRADERIAATAAWLMLNAG